MKNLEGKRVQMLSMKDPDPIQCGERGTVVFVDALNQIHVKWDNGRNLAIVPETDSFVILEG